MKNYFIIIVAIISLLTSCKKDSLDGGVVMYEVENTSISFNVTYSDGDGKVVKETIHNKKWNTEFKAPSGAFLHISAKTNHLNSTITANIYYDGRLVQTATNKGDYVAATASYTLP